MNHKRQILLDCALAFLLTAALILPLFRIAYFDNWMSIEGSFIADARYIVDHWPHPRWHALWYCGTRFDYIYPPLTRYGAAISALLFHVEPARGYHIYTAAMYCLGVAGVYFLVRIGTLSRGAAFTAAAAEALLSPSFLFLKTYREDSFLMMPARLNFLIRWGEGPHMSAFALIPWAIALSLLALERRRLAALSAAAVAAALVVSNNFYGAVALAIFFPIAVFPVWIASRERAVFVRAAAIAVLAYGLCAWWLVPSYIELTARNLTLVALPGNSWSKWVALAVVAAFLAAGWRLGRDKSAAAYPVFVWGSLAIFGLQVLGQHWFGFRITGEPMRFVPELDLLLILAALEGIRRLWRAQRIAAVLVTVACFSFSANYLLRAWTVFEPERDYRRRIEYRLTEWIAQNLPGQRTFATGSIRFWYTAWRDIAQVSGASDQGMGSLTPAIAQWLLTMGNDPELDVYWMVALGADAIVAHDAGSQEVFHHMKFPRKFMGRLPVIYDREGDIIYKVPRRFPGLARIVDARRMQALPPVPFSHKLTAPLRAYVEAVEASDSAVTSEWQDVSAMRLRGRAAPGESVLAQVTWDPGWHAYGQGPLEISKDPIGFMLIRTPPGEFDIGLVYETPLESRIGGGLMAFAVAAAIGLTITEAARSKT